MAVRVALELLLMDVVVALKIAERGRCGHRNRCRNREVELVFDRTTLAPPLGAGWVSVTVQVLEEFGPRLAGLQAREDSSTGATG